MGWASAFVLQGLRHALTFVNSQDTDEVDVTVCTFDQPEATTPGDHTWVEDRLPWIRLDDGLPTYGRQRQNHAG